MLFTVLPVRGRPPEGASSQAFLVSDRWDDHTFKTQYWLIWVESGGISHDIGAVKFGQFGMGERRSPDVPNQFDTLDESFFSIGQDSSYYEKLNDLGVEVRDSLLLAIRDLSLDMRLFEQARGEDVTKTSLLRSVPQATVEHQFRRMARGEARLSAYKFNYLALGEADPQLTFEVEPESMPPTNVHVLIGRNGVGKTTLLKRMAAELVTVPRTGEWGAFVQPFGTLEGYSSLFANVVSVTFSAFDEFQDLEKKNEGDVKYSYVGLVKYAKEVSGRLMVGEDGRPIAIPIEQQFSDSLSLCLQGARRDRWRGVLESLDSDPVFSESGVSSLIQEGASGQELADRARELFEKMSSGHKVVLLTVTRLVETVEERSLVLMDEPEAHLHPPLLSAFIRALSNLLTNRNGVAVIATHSPVVLQEVPKSCVWKVRRVGYSWAFDRPVAETFGENVSVLTREVFGLEVNKSGFHRMIEDLVDEGMSYDEVEAVFHGELGGEAKVILRTLIALRERELGDA